jgi:hypothetical protein
MRIAVLIIALALSLIILVQSCAASAVGSLAEDEETSSAAGAGFLVAVLFIVAAGFVLSKPKAWVIIFLVAAPIALLGAVGSEFGDLYVWTVVALALAGMSYLGLKAKRREDLEAAAQSAAETRPTKTCPDCAETILLDASACRYCGYRFAEEAPLTN